MNSRDKQRHLYIRNAALSFGCTAVCIGVDIRNFIMAGHFYLNWNIGISIVIYVVLIMLGIRAVKKIRELKKEGE